jgi:nitrogen fixation protein FixH
MESHPKTARRRPTPAWKSPWVIAWVGLVVAVLGVNLTMVYLAIATNPGLVVEDYYDRGQHYEKNILSKQASDPGWQMYADVPQEIKAAETTTIRFFVTDQAGQPVRVEGVDFFAYRPSDAERDFSLPMAEEGEGRYKVELVFPLVGIWDSLFAVRHGEDEFTLGRRISVLRP